MSDTTLRPLGYVERGVLPDLSTRFVFSELAEAAGEVERRHQLSGDTAALATAGLASAVLLTADIKGAERITLHVKGEKPVFSFVADVDADGGFRAGLSPGALEPSPDWLQGIFAVIRTNQSREISRGVTALDAADLADALEEHLRRSDQIQAAIRMTRKPQHVHALRLEPLPGRPLIDVPDGDWEGWWAAIRGSVDMVERIPLHWRCSCSNERVESILQRLGSEELMSMAVEQGGAEVTCEFCREIYRVSLERLVELAGRVS